MRGQLTRTATLESRHYGQHDAQGSVDADEQLVLDAVVPRREILQQQYDAYDADRVACQRAHRRHWSARSRFARLTSNGALFIGCLQIKKTYLRTSRPGCLRWRFSD